MPLYTTEVNALKKELMELRRFNKVLGFERQEKSLEEYKMNKFCLESSIVKKLNKIKQDVLLDINTFCKSKAVLDLSENSVEKTTACITDSSNTEIASTVNEDASVLDDIYLSKENTDNYFNAAKLELLLDRINLQGFRDLETNDALTEKVDVTEIVKSLDKVFSYELLKIKAKETGLSKVAITQRILKVQEKIRANKINEASVLMSRFYTESKKDIVMGYLYFEILYAKAALGNQKSLSIARDIANNVCFLTERSDEKLVNYYRYIYVCREFVYDKQRSLQLFRDFVLLSQDKMLSSKFLVEDNGYYAKCLILFLMFDFNDWNAYEIESISQFVLKAIAGGLFYVAFMRSKLINHIDTQRYGVFLQAEIELDNIYNSHKNMVKFIHSNFKQNGKAVNSTKGFYTIGQKFVRDFFVSAKVPSFSEYITNTSLSGIQYLSDTENDAYLASIGISEFSLWRIWISKIISETSLQRQDILPIEQVVKEVDLINKYYTLTLKMNEFEKEIYNLEKYKDIRKLLANTTQNGIIKVIMGENQYSVFDYGFPWSALKNYYGNIKVSNNSIAEPLATDLMFSKGKKGLFWNLEEIQMMLESINLILDNKSIGIKARLDALLEQKAEDMVDKEYMSLSEHLELYWWCYILLISVFIFMFNML